MNGSLNHCLKVVWNEARHAWVVVSELAKGNSNAASKTLNHVVPCSSSGTFKSSRPYFQLKAATVLSLVVATVLPGLSHALPSGAEVVFGNMSYQNYANQLTIHQNSYKLIAIWQNFDIAKGEVVQLLQPKDGSALFNILSNNASQIFGQLNATGHLFLYNPNGILFGETANVNVGSIVASSLKLENLDFLNNRYQFSGDNRYGNVVNKGVIHAKNDGYIVLLGETVSNQGSLVAPKGTVALASANQAVLDFYGNGLLRVKLSGDALNALVSNEGSIQANGGIVQMASNARSAAINTTGVIEAHQLVERDGVIRLEAGDTGTVTVDGKLDVSASATQGGSIKVLGDKVELLAHAQLDATGQSGGGEVLIGGNAQGLGPEQNASTTLIAEGAKVDASALQHGDGGKIIVWGTDAMASQGELLARGGKLSGDGGFIETSSHGTFTITQAPDVGASHGAAGTWLIDPIDLVINNGATTNVNNTGSSSAPNFTPSNAPASISWATINQGLANGNVVVKTTGTGTAGAGDITVTADGVLNNPNKLTLDAAGKLDFTHNLTRTASGDVSLIANNDITLSGTMTLANNSGLNLHSKNGAVDIKVDVVTKGGDVTVQADKRIDFTNITTTSSALPGNATSVSGKVKLVTNTGDISGQHIITTGTTNGGGGAISIESGAAVSIGNLNASAGALNANNAGRSAGNIAVSGFGNVKVGNIVANGSNALGNNNNGGNSGEIALLSAQQVTVGSITSQSGLSSGLGNSGANRDVVLTTLNSGGHITVTGDITTSGGNVIALAKTAGDISLSKITTTSQIPSNTATTTVSGKVNLVTLQGSITTQDINTAGSVNGAGGAVSIEASNGSVQTGAINTSGGSVAANLDGRSAGNLSIAATNDVKVGNISAKGSNGQGTTRRGGNSGEVSLLSSNGNITFAEIDSTAGSGQLGGGLGRNIVIKAALDVTMQGNISSSSQQNPSAGNDPAVLIVAGEDFDNSANKNISFTSGALGSWLIYAKTPLTTVRGSPLESSYGFKEYGRTYSSAAVPVGTSQGFKNGFIYAQPQFIDLTLTGFTIKPFDGNALVTNPGTLAASASLVDNDQLVAPIQLSNLLFNNATVGTGKPVTGTLAISTGVINSAGLTTMAFATDSAGRPVFGYQQGSTTSIATGTIFIGPTPRDSAGLGSLLTNLNLFSGLTVQSLNPAAGDDDPDYVPCPENNDRIGRNPVLNSGVKLPDEVIATCI